MKIIDIVVTRNLPGYKSPEAEIIITGLALLN
jgi:hypothetical protein